MLALALALLVAPVSAQDAAEATLPPDGKPAVAYAPVTRLKFDEVGIDVPVERPAVDLVYVPPGMYFHPRLPVRQDFEDRIEASVSAVR